MAHYARVNKENIVTFVTPIPSDMITDVRGIEHEEWAFKHLYETIPDSLDDKWVQTSYNNNLRKNYAGIGYTYDEQKDAFIPPKPYESWILNEETCLWQAPVEHPDNEKLYIWNEEIKDWTEINL